MGVIASGRNEPWFAEGPLTYNPPSGYNGREGTQSMRSRVRSGSVEIEGALLGREDLKTIGSRFLII